MNIMDMLNKLGSFTIKRGDFNFNHWYGVLVFELK